MNLHFGQITLRNAQEKDCEQIAAWWNDGSVMAHAGFPKGLGTCAEKIIKSLAQDSDETRRLLVIECSGTLAGEMNFRKHGNVTEIGIKICRKEFQNRGLGKVVLSMLIEELFCTGTERIVLDTNLKNTRAQHVYEALGFRKVKVEQNCFIDQLGESQAVVFYELVQQDFICFKNSELICTE